MNTSIPVKAPVRVRTVALVGNPNTGKSTIFNCLTGFRQRVGNYPGVTVEHRSGRLRNAPASSFIDVVDLPGTYSLAVHQEDEAIVLDVLLGRREGGHIPDVIVSIVDASNLRRNLFLTTQILELERPVIVALNMTDLAESAGICIDADALSRELGVPVIPIVATKQIGIDNLIEAISSSVSVASVKHCQAFPDCVCAELDALCTSISGQAGCDNGHRAEAMQTLLAPGGYHELQTIQRCGIGMAEELAERRKRIAEAGESVVEVEARVRYAWIDRVLEKTVKHTAPNRASWTERADRVLTHPVLGLATFFILMGLGFQAIYAWAQPLMSLVDGIFLATGGAAASLLPEGAIQSLIVDGMIAGVGAVLIFLPQIAILFFFIAILEDCGYMARAAFLLDRWMNMFGLTGKAFIPLLSSFACAVPGIMATRSIESKRDRLATILIAPLMSCSARLPVYVLLIGAFIPAVPLLGGFLNLQAATLLAMYCVGTVVAIGIAFILKRTVLKGPAQSFLMELPTFKWPSGKTVFHRVYQQAREFTVTAGTIIFAVAIVIWALAYYPHPSSLSEEHDARRAAAQSILDAQVADAAAKLGVIGDSSSVAEHPRIVPIMVELDRLGSEFVQAVDDAESAPDSAEWNELRAEFDERVTALVEKHGPEGDAALLVWSGRRDLAEELDHIDREESGAYLRNSILGRMGHWIEPAVRPLGWDWRIGTAAIASFPAREVIVATMGTIYNLGNDQDEESLGLRGRLRAATWPDGRPVFNVAVALSIMVFFALCCQCGATLATIKRETRSWRWPIITFAYMTALAYVAALVVYQVAIRIT